MATLTKSNTFIIGWVALILGFIMDLLFNLTGSIGLENVGLCIILFTIISNLIMLPLTIKQQRSQKIMTVMQPEIQAIQAKYKDKQGDQAAMAKMQAETKAVYEKYGTSMTGGCSYLIIQMPILFALYQVIYRIPGYVHTVYDKLAVIAEGVMAQAGYADKIAELATGMRLQNMDFSKIENMIDFLYKLNPSQWQTLQSLFPSVQNMAATAEWSEKINSFFTINLSTNPWQGFVPSVAWLIPILAGVTQWLSVKIMTPQNPNQDDSENPAAQSMKMMNMTMPLMSVFFCFTFPAGLGLYWIASAVVRTIIQIFINKSFEKTDINEMIRQNVEKANKKREKKGLPPQKLDERAIEKAKRANEYAAAKEERDEIKRQKTAKITEDSEKYYNLSAKPGSLAARANMVAMYDQRMEEKKHGKKKEENKEKVNE